MQRIAEAWPARALWSCSEVNFMDVAVWAVNYFQKPQGEGGQFREIVLDTRPIRGILHECFDSSIYDRY